jgi:Helix-turn-helix domain
MTLPRSHAYLGRPPHAPHAASLDPRYQTEGRPVAGRPAGPDAPQLAGDPGRSPEPERSPEPGQGPASGSLPSERVWEQRRALGRQLASLRSRSGFSQWEFAPLTGYSRSTLSDAELGRHRLRREFWERCDSALMTDGVLTTVYDRIEVAATALRRSARSQAQAAREEQAARRLQALLPAPGLPAPGAVGLGAASAAGPAPVAATAPHGPAPEPDGITWGSAGSAGTAVGVIPGMAASGRALGGAVPPRATPDVLPRIVADGVLSAVTRVEQCPHCLQPVTVIIVAAAPPAATPPSAAVAPPVAGGPAG